MTSMHPVLPAGAAPRSSLTVPPEPATFVRLSCAHEAGFARFLADLQTNGDHAFFHPHPLDAAAARALVMLAAAGPDEYWLLAADEVLAYGMLRGWAEGYAVPSLGLAVAPRHRGRGLARRFMHHLHARARDRGARQVRLKVERENSAAHRLYETLGYVFQDHSPTELLGVLTLAGRPTAAV